MAKVTGPMTYRAACGHTITDKRNCPKGKRLGRMVKGWRGDQRTKSMKQDTLPPEQCTGCRHLKREHLEMFDDEAKTSYRVQVWICHTYRAINTEVTDKE